jgi:tight adherence protein B
MIAVALSALAVLLTGVAVRPRPAPRRTQPSAPDAARDTASAAARRRLPSLALPVRRRAEIDPADLAVWCDSLARGLRGGATLHHALRSTPPPAPVVDRLAPALLALERGATVTGALAGIHTGSADLDLVVVVLRACAEHGGAAAEPIDRAATALRQRSALAGERRTQSAQARMSAIVMTILPGAMLAMLLVTSPPVRTTAGTPLGLTVISCGALLNLAGWWWMRRMIEGAGR